MAIHPNLPGVEVVVCVNGVPLDEFEDDEAEQPAGDDDITNRMSKYIKSAEGQEFIIQWSLRSPYQMECDAIWALVYIDGKLLARKSIVSEDYDGDEKEAHITGAKVADQENKRFLYPFKFSTIKTTLDEDAFARVENDKDQIANVGSLRVEFWRKGHSKLRAAHDRRKDYSIPALPEVHEKALKGQPKYHSVSLGEAGKPVPKQSKKRWQRKSLDQSPFACFIFKYRSEAALKQLLIIERTPEPEEAETLDLNQLDAEEKRQVEELLRNLRQPGSNRGVSVKQEPGSNRGLSIKRERDDGEGSRGAPKKARTQEVIDLTDD